MLTLTLTLTLTVTVSPAAALVGRVKGRGYESHVLHCEMVQQRHLKVGRVQGLTLSLTLTPTLTLTLTVRVQGGKHVGHVQLCKIV